MPEKRAPRQTGRSYDASARSRGTESLRRSTYMFRSTLKRARGGHGGRKDRDLTRRRTLFRAQRAGGPEVAEIVRRPSPTSSWARLPRADTQTRSQTGGGGRSSALGRVKQGGAGKAWSEAISVGSAWFPDPGVRAAAARRPQGAPAQSASKPMTGRRCSRGPRGRARPGRRHGRGDRLQTPPEARRLWGRGRLWGRAAKGRRGRRAGPRGRRRSRGTGRAGGEETGPAPRAGGAGGRAQNGRKTVARKVFLGVHLYKGLKSLSRAMQLGVRPVPNR